MKTASLTHAATGRLRRRLISALSGFGVIVATMAGTATPADAASSLYGCFRTSTNGYSVQYMQLLVEAWTGNSWARVGTTYTNMPGGCAYLPVYGELRKYHLRFRAYMTEGHTIYYSHPNVFINYAYPGNQPADVGTGYVVCNGTPCSPW